MQSLAVISKRLLWKQFSIPLVFKRRGKIGLQYELLNFTYFHTNCLPHTWTQQFPIHSSTFVLTVLSQNQSSFAEWDYAVIRTTDKKTTHRSGGNSWISNVFFPIFELIELNYWTFSSLSLYFDLRLSTFLLLWDISSSKIVCSYGCSHNSLLFVVIPELFQNLWLFFMLEITF